MAKALRMEIRRLGELFQENVRFEGNPRLENSLVKMLLRLCTRCQVATELLESDKLS
jgi:hypothetical protein